MAGSRTPGSLGQGESPVQIKDGTSCLAVSPLPGPKNSQSGSVADWDVSTKLIEAAKRATPLLPEEMREEFASLFTPEAIGLTALVLGAWAGSHFFGVGQVADIILLLTALGVLGWQAFRAASDLCDFFVIASNAKTEGDLQQAAGHLARAVAVVGVTAFVSLITKGAGKGAKVLRRGSVKGKPHLWWKADNFGPNYPGTAIPQGFTFTVGQRIFVVKPNATKHMADHARQNASVGAYAGNVEFPLSSLAGALEQAEARGHLAPLLRKEVARLGTLERPFRIGDWELSLELVSGNLEVLHAVYKP